MVRFVNAAFNQTVINSLCVCVCVWPSVAVILQNKTNFENIMGSRFFYLHTVWPK